MLLLDEMLPPSLAAMPNDAGCDTAAIVHRHQHDDWPAPGQFEFL